MTSRILARRLLAASAFTATAALVLAGCAGGTGGSTGEPTEDKATEYSILVATENTQFEPLFAQLAANECEAENEALPYRIDKTPSADLQAKVQLLAGQDQLPVQYSGSQQSITPGGDLDKAGQVLNIQDTLDELGVGDNITDAAKSVIDQLYNGGSSTMPMQFNIEGLFYNKKIFADNDIEIPTTLDELTAAAEKLKAAGVTPFVASGKTGWTISRWVGALLFSTLGPDALEKVRDGEAKLTDPEYVAAAQMLQDLGPYFIDGISNLDYDTMNSQILNGQAAMMYMGTWFLAAVNDPAQNKIGDDIGFFGFPGIDGYPANVGGANAINAKLYGPKVGAWLKCLSENVGTVSLRDFGSFSGFRVNTPVDDLSPITADIQDKINNAPGSVLWFEALMGSKATADSSANAAPLLTGAMSAQDFMAQIQADLDSQ